MTGTLTTLGRLGPVVFVECGPEAHAFVVDAWCKSYEPVALEHLGMSTPDKLAPVVRKAVCAGLYAKVKAILARPDTRIICGVAESDETVVVCFAVWEPALKDTERIAEPELLHYLYVKADMRRQGLAKWLLGYLQNERDGRYVDGYTHHSPAGATLARDYHLQYRPEEANP